MYVWACAHVPAGEWRPGVDIGQSALYETQFLTESDGDLARYSGQQAPGSSCLHPLPPMLELQIGSLILSDFYVDVVNPISGQCLRSRDLIVSLTSKSNVCFVNDLHKRIWADSIRGNRVKSFHFRSLLMIHIAQTLDSGLQEP